MNSQTAHIQLTNGSQTAHKVGRDPRARRSSRAAFGCLASLGCSRGSAPTNCETV